VLKPSDRLATGHSCYNALDAVIVKKGGDILPKHYKLTAIQRDSSSPEHFMWWHEGAWNRLKRYALDEKQTNDIFAPHHSILS